MNELLERLGLAADSAQARLDQWRDLDRALTAQRLADRLSGAPALPIELDNALYALASAQIRLAAAQLSRVPIEPSR